MPPRVLVRRDRGVDGGLVGDVHLDGAQVDPVRGRVVGRVGDGGGVAALGVADAGVDDVPRVGEGADGHGSEAPIGVLPLMAPK